MSYRSDARIKVTVEWTQRDRTITGCLANDTIVNSIKAVTPNKFEADLQAPIQLDISRRGTVEADYHTHVYRFKYKRSFPNTKMANFNSIFHFIFKLFGMRRPYEEFDFKVTVDTQANHFPWVFNNQPYPVDGQPLVLALRPESVEYTIKHKAPVVIPNRNQAFYEMMGWPCDPDIEADEFRIIGHPRTAEKIYRHYLEQLRNGKHGNRPNLNPPVMLHHCIDDLVCVLHRHSRVRSQWGLMNPNGPKAYGDLMTYILANNIPDHVKASIPDLGFRYTLLDPNA